MSLEPLSRKVVRLEKEMEKLNRVIEENTYDAIQEYYGERVKVYCETLEELSRYYRGLEMTRLTISLIDCFYSDDDYLYVVFKGVPPFTYVNSEIVDGELTVHYKLREHKEYTERINELIDEVNDIVINTSDNMRKMKDLSDKAHHNLGRIQKEVQRARIAVRTHRENARNRRLTRRR